MCYLLVLLLTLLTVCPSNELKTLRKDDTYTEEVLIKRLKHDNLLYQFRFIITTNAKHDSYYDVFPRIIHQVITKHRVDEFHLSLTQGYWRTREWGFAPQPSAPSGAQLYAWFSGNETSVNTRWNNFVNSMNGIFCTSLLQMLPTYVASQEFSFSPNGYMSPEVTHHLRFGALTDETVCTENFTPWRKLLPCKQTGLSSVINPIKLYEAAFHSLSLHLLPVCEDGSADCGNRLRLELNLNLVTDVNLYTKSLDWSLYDVFQRRVDQQCHVANSSVIITEVGRKFFNLTEGGTRYEHEGRTYVVFNLTKESPNTFPVDVSAKYNNPLNLLKSFPETLLTIHSYVAGTGQQSGSIVSLMNNEQAVEQRITYSQIIPWFIKIYYHTIRFKCEVISADKKKEHAKVKKKVFIPAIDRLRPFSIELDVTIPAKSACELSYEFDEAFLRVSEFPPDANHGHYIPSAVISFMAADELFYMNRTSLGDPLLTALDELSGARPSRKITIYSEALLILLPVPDFSMPFNVICLVCTAIAMLFGPVHTLTTKIMIPLAEKDKDLAPKPPLRRLLSFLYEAIVKWIRLHRKTK